MRQSCTFGNRPLPGLLLPPLLLLLLGPIAPAGIRQAQGQPEQFQPRSVACDPGCAVRGNCNRELGTCECPFGWEGPTCEELLLPACRSGPTTPGAHVFTGRRQPRNCHCYSQLRRLACDRTEQDRCRHPTPTLWPDLVCFARKGVAAEDQLSKLPRSLEDPDYEWFRGRVHVHEPGTSTHRRQVTKSWEHLPSPPTAEDTRWRYPANCTARCSEHGVCDTSGNCVCEHGWQGAGTCSQRVPASDAASAGGASRACPAGCSGRGECAGGFCKCELPYWGIGCGRRRAYEPTKGSAPPPPYAQPLSIYMYDVPMSVAGPFDMDDGLNYVVSLYRAEHAFMEQLLADTAVRTENPWQANAFFLPTFAMHAAGNLGDPTMAVQSAVRWARGALPFFNRTGGRDHFVVLPMDRGACSLKPGPLTERLIKVVHFGMEKWNLTEFGPLAVSRPHGCFHPARDIVAAPHWAIKPRLAASLDDTLRALREPGGASKLLADKTVLLAFAGDTRPHEPEYSGGVRQAVAAQLRGYNGSDVEFHTGWMPLQGPEYEVLLRRSRFCLAPYGHGFGIRLSHALLHACVPVIVQDHVHQPYEDLLPYHEFSLRLRKHELPGLLPLLRAVSEERLAAMLHAGAAAARAFVWQPQLNGSAYTHLLESLRRRLSHMRGGLDNA